ncbi:peptide deformylase [Roseisalinus antarcticus]|uniref:Peptide deformylase n=1 Tax=Roseisalinus antarcticus TaxID=254357 RepID=A0A1Y5SPB1_9RHOB|nr:peptide deformylase [Roseisalinus antarcticus]SLN44698.1 Peptide deformylase [Roseisalinus antarcticus]
MALLKILHWPDPRLSRVCDDIRDVAGVRGLAADMLETMYDAPGRGLAAPQVGAMVRLFVMDVTWKEAKPAPRVMINPTVLSSDGVRVVAEEGCLSIPGVLAPVERPEAVRMRWTDLDGRACDEVLEGAAARCAQHELDHLDGIVTLDRLSPEARAAAIGDLAR